MTHESIDCIRYHDVVKDFDCTGPEEECRPEIVVLCGSTRYFEAFRQANLELTIAGKIVLSIGCDTKSDHDLEALRTAGSKVKLDELHKRKIDLADSVYVLNVNGYVGESTRSEINYARSHTKPVTFLVEGEYVCAACGRDNRNGTHTALEGMHLNHEFEPKWVPAA